MFLKRENVKDFVTLLALCFITFLVPYIHIKVMTGSMILFKAAAFIMSCVKEKLHSTKA